MIKDTDFVIENGIPLPPDDLKFPFDTMKIGESVKIPKWIVDNRWSDMVKAMKNEVGKPLRMTYAWTEGGCVRVWRKA